MRRTGGRFSQREREGERGGWQENQTPHKNISMQLAIISVSSVRPKLRYAATRPRDRPLSRYRHANSLCIGGQCTCDFCEARKENRAACVACNQSHAVRARCIVLRFAARGHAPSIVNIARGHSCDDVQRLSACPFLTTRAVHCKGKFFAIV